jgi:hypothetical protein
MWFIHYMLGQDMDNGIGQRNWIRNLRGTDVGSGRAIGCYRSRTLLQVLILFPFLLGNE